MPSVSVYLKCLLWVRAQPHTGEFGLWLCHSLLEDCASYFKFTDTGFLCLQKTEVIHCFEIRSERSSIVIQLQNPKNPRHIKRKRVCKSLEERGSRLCSLFTFHFGCWSLIWVRSIAQDCRVLYIFLKGSCTRPCGLGARSWVRVLSHCLGKFLTLPVDFLSVKQVQPSQDMGHQCSFTVVSSAVLTGPVRVSVTRLEMACQLNVFQVLLALKKNWPRHVKMVPKVYLKSEGWRSKGSTDLQSKLWPNKRKRDKRAKMKVHPLFGRHSTGRSEEWQ